jgi:spore cortex formation protein SpoVR/YcgB (stage V sporulation)
LLNLLKKNFAVMRMKYVDDYNATIEYARKDSRKETLAEVFSLWESGVPLAEAKKRFGLTKKNSAVMRP